MARLSGNLPSSLPVLVIGLVAAVLIGPARGHLRTAIVLGAPLVTLWFIWQVPNGVAYDVAFLDYRIEPLEGSEVRRLFATIFALMAFVGGLYAFRQAKWYELSAAYAYAAGAIGVSFAGDLITLFLYWELMALFSTVVVWCGGTPEARRAGIRYAIMHLLGGVILKVGIEGVVGDRVETAVAVELDHLADGDTDPGGIHQIGDGGITLSGGDRKSLAPAGHARRRRSGSGG